jgi:hypothetical protein
MISHPAPSESDPHSKRIIVDTAEWRDRLERLAEIRQAASESETSPAVAGAPPG